MKVSQLNISGCYVFEHKTFPDDRGLFREWFRAEELNKFDSNFSVMQANFSQSKLGVVRGIHYSLAPKGQSKLITCVEGEITDVLVDLRKGSPTYLNVEHTKLEANSGKAVFVASGVGHGFAVLSASASVVYLTSSPFAPEFEKSINPIDPAFDINWNIPAGVEMVLSPSDRSASSLQEADAAGYLPTY
jgi:dTDP-4-dehydrorhamnose 3,5-epimerase